MSQETLSCFSPLSKSVVIGSRYVHYKGNHYVILAIARHSETLEELVVYQDLGGKGDVWVRPLNMFLENIEYNGLIQPRFKLIRVS